MKLYMPAVKQFRIMCNKYFLSQSLDQFGDVNFSAPKNDVQSNKKPVPLDGAYIREILRVERSVQSSSTSGSLVYSYNAV